MSKVKIGLFIFFLILLFFIYNTYALSISKDIQDLTAFIQTLKFTVDGTPTGTSNIIISGIGGSNGKGYGYLNGDLWVGKGNGDSLFVNSNIDKVGIGTTSPGYKLHVVGDLKADFNILTDSSIGIGTTQPNRKLHIKDLSQNAEIDIQSNNNYYRAIYHNKSDDQLRIRSNNFDKINISSNGNIGIGLENPLFRLHVNGDISANSKIKENGYDLVPKGFIGMFNLSSCPGGWSPISQLNGRFPVGVGNDGQGNNYGLGTWGGESRHTLSFAEMPSHNHSIWIPDTNRGTGTMNTCGLCVSQGSAIPSNVTRIENTSYAGNNQSHENRPPFYGVLFCQKD